MIFFTFKTNFLRNFEPDVAYLVRIQTHKAVGNKYIFVKKKIMRMICRRWIVKKNTQIYGKIMQNSQLLGYRRKKKIMMNMKHTIHSVWIKGADVYFFCFQFFFRNVFPFSYWLKLNLIKQRWNYEAICTKSKLLPPTDHRSLLEVIGQRYYQNK